VTHHGDVGVLSLTVVKPFVSSVGIAWTAYLSLTNAAEDARESESSSNENAIQL
jgi:hypothetical protein